MFLRNFHGGTLSLMKHTELKMRNQRLVCKDCDAALFMLASFNLYLCLTLVIRDGERSSIPKQIITDRNALTEQSS